MSPGPPGAPHADGGPTPGGDAQPRTQGAHPRRGRTALAMGGTQLGRGRAAQGMGGLHPWRGCSALSRGSPIAGGARRARAKLTVAGHANQQALLEAALLAAVAVDADDGAVLVLEALLVLDVLLDAAAEKALRGGTVGCHSGSPQHGGGSVSLRPQPRYLAALAGVNAVVEAGGDVPADLAEQHHPVQLCGETGMSRVPGCPCGVGGPPTLARPTHW